MKFIINYLTVLLTLPLFIIFDIRAVIANRYLTSEDILDLYMQFLKWLPKGLKLALILPVLMLFATKGHFVPVLVCSILFLTFAILAVCEFFNPKFLD